MSELPNVVVMEGFTVFDNYLNILLYLGHSQPVAEITQDVSADLDVSCKPRLTADSNTQSNQGRVIFTLINS